MTYSVFDSSPRQATKLFLDPNNNGPGIARFDKPVFPIFEKLVEKQNGFMWREQEVDILRDKNDFRALTPAEQHIFTSNLKRQILLDTITARSPAIAFLPLCSQPEIENWIQTWSYFETIHSRAYTHIIRNVYPTPSVVLDGITSIAEVVDCAGDISLYYDNLIDVTRRYQSSEKPEELINELRRALYLAIMSANVLEGVRFYVSFACSWAFAEQKKSMEGNAKIIKLIARDENIHLAATQHMLKILRDDPDFAQVVESCKEECVQMFKKVLEQEKAWAKYLFKDGSMVGLNYEMLDAYLEWLVHKRMSAVGLPPLGRSGTNPLPWTQRWIGGSEVQSAPQEVTKVDYIVGRVKQDVTNDTFKGLSL